jgi:pullulanase-type alpha-1,6-glucosidase
VIAVNDLDGFNWGYDPFHFNVPEGSYSTNADGVQRIIEFREMVQSLNQNDLRVVMDVVYNHTNASGQGQKSVFDKIVPGYYHRLNADGVVEKSTCCENTATEHMMMQKFMLDSVQLWAEAYKVDGFRFDLMGHHMKENMIEVRDLLDTIDPSIYVYGEGWNFGEVADGIRGENATQINLAGTGIGTFNDRLRDAVRGGGPFDGGESLVTNQGFINGAYYDMNDMSLAAGLTATHRAELMLSADQIRVGLAGNLADYSFTDRTGTQVTGSQVDYNGSPAGYNQDPQEHIIYVSAHDNQTLYDNNVYKVPTQTTMANRVRVQNLGLDLTMLSQGVPFFHAGVDMLRSKSLERDSYNSGDWFNKLDFTYMNNNFGVGIPPKAEGDDALMAPFLRDPNLQPTQTDILSSVTHMHNLLQIRNSTPLFRLQTEQDVMDRLAFHNTGADQLPGLIVMSISDMVSGTTDLDPNHEMVVVLFNANDEAQVFTETALVGVDLELHPVQQASADAVVKTATFDSSTGVFNLPARTTAVYVLPQGEPQGPTIYLPLIMKTTAP